MGLEVVEREIWVVRWAVAAAAEVKRKAPGQKLCAGRRPALHPLCGRRRWLRERRVRHTARALARERHGTCHNPPPRLNRRANCGGRRLIIAFVPTLRFSSEREVLLAFLVLQLILLLRYAFFVIVYIWEAPHFSPRSSPRLQFITHTQKDYILWHCLDCKLKAFRSRKHKHRLWMPK